MKAIVIKTAKGLRGSTDEDHEAWLKFKRKLDGMKPGSWLKIEATTPRNGKHHRKLMALLKLITDNSETYDTIPKALVAIKLIVGYFDPAIHPVTGELIQVPKSISYDAMDQDEFDAFYSSAIDAVLQHILPQIDKETADRLIEEIVLGWT